MKGFYIIVAASVALAWLELTFGHPVGATQVGRIGYIVGFLGAPALTGLAIAGTKAASEWRQGKSSTFACDLQWIWGGLLVIIGITQVAGLAA